MNMPTVSVILSVFNNRAELPAAIASLVRQTWSDFEIIAIDDGSTDGSGLWLDEYAKHEPRLRVVHQTNRGLGPALATGCHLAQGEFLARQDADDLSAPTRLARQVGYLQNHPKVVVCGTWAWYAHPTDGPEYTYEIPDDAQLLKRLLLTTSNPFVHGSIMMRRAAYQQAPYGYRLRRYCEDLDLWLQLSEVGRLGMVASLEYVYMTSIGGMSYGNLFLRQALGELTRRLSRERQTLGREQTDWRAAEAQVLGNATDEQSSEFRQTAIDYTRGLLALRRKDYSRFGALMRQAAAGSGPLALKAQRLGQFAPVAPALRRYYRWRERNSHAHYLRSSSTEMPWPEFVTEINRLLVASVHDTRNGIDRDC